MNEYERKLCIYRTEERRKKFILRCKEYLKKPIDFTSSMLNSNETDSDEVLINQNDHEAVITPDQITETEDDVELEEKFNWFKFVISSIIWMGLFSYSVYIEFGVIFLIISGFYFIWINTRTKPKRRNELSAYSVFNPNCERIQGTLDAEQIESEIRYGMAF